jgi:hypothetical protein
MTILIFRHMARRSSFHTVCLIFAHGSRGSGLATLGLLWKGVEPLDSGTTAMRRLIKPISTLLLVAIRMAVVDPALAGTRTARNGEAVRGKAK